MLKVPVAPVGCPAMSDRKAPARRKLLEEATRLWQLAERCENLVDHGQLSAVERNELRNAAWNCRELAAELAAAADEAI